MKHRVHLRAQIALLVFSAAHCCLAHQPAESLSDTNTFTAPANLTTQQDHKLMMELLGIKSLRPGFVGVQFVHSPPKCRDPVVTRSTAFVDFC